MASLTPQKIVLSDINGGQQFANGDVVTPEAINSPIQASAYAQALATNQPDVSEAGNVGTPSVSIITASDGTPRLKFSNLKGATGAAGASGSAGSSSGIFRKPVYEFDMFDYQSSGYAPIRINARDGEYGAILIGKVYSNGCYTLSPAINIDFGYYVYEGEDTNQEWVATLGAYKIRCSGMYAWINSMDDGWKIGIKADAYEDVVFDIDIDPTLETMSVNISTLKATYN